MPVSEDEERVIPRIPGLAVALSQRIGQGIPYLQAGELAQEVFQGEVLIGEAIQHLQPLSLIVVQLVGAGQTQDGQVEQMIQLVLVRLWLAVDHPQGDLRVCPPVAVSGCLQTGLHSPCHTHLLLCPFEGKKTSVVQRLVG